MSTPAPAGAWPSQITAASVVSAAVRLGEVRVSRAGDGTDLVWWSEQRPEERGRTTVLRRRIDGSVDEVLPADLAAYSHVHEYGGAAWLPDGEALFAVGEADQRIRRIEGDRVTTITPEPPEARAWRYALGAVTQDGWLLCVQEVHREAGEPLDRLVAVPVGGGDPVLLFDGTDFVGTPVLDRERGLVAFVTWDHPDMPWDATRLWVARFEGGGGDRPRLVSAAPVAGGFGESICQPRWSPEGRLWFVSDRTDWWNLYAFDEPGLPAAGAVPAAMAPTAAEVGEPAWVFGQSRYDFLGDGRLAFAQRSEGRDSLAVLDPRTGVVEPLDVPSTEIAALAAAATTVVYVGASYTAEPGIHAVLAGRNGAASAPQALRPPRALGLSSGHLAVGRHITYPTGPDGDGLTAHGTFYPPTNPEHVPLPGELPPLVVVIHGGPTASARAELRLAVQFWTSRGFAVVDVDYRGSTGYGRRYREQLLGEWGVADVEDCVAAARHLVAEGLVDPDRLLIRGSSAGGFTTLAALTFTDTFAAGASYYGVADLALLATDTHKFEARYLDGLVGPYPDAADLYEARSPLTQIDRLDRPVIVFQGTLDKVVPPNQAEAIVEALARRGVPHSYLLLEGEGHGFRQAPNIVRTLEAEWSFYLQVLGIPHPDDLPRVEVRR